MSPSDFRNVCAMRSTSAVRRIVGNESLRNLIGNVVSGVRIARQNIQDFFAVFHSTGVNLMPEDGFRAVVVNAIVEEEFGVAARLLDRPSGKGLCDIDDVVLRVAAIDAERVQFHQLAAIIFVQAAFLILLPFRIRIIWIRHSAADRSPGNRGMPNSPRCHRMRWRCCCSCLQLFPRDGIGGQPIVQEKQHRRTLRRGFEQIAEFPHRMRANRVALVRSDQPAVGALGGKDIEVVVPEVHHHFVELALAVNGARHLGHGKFGDNPLRRANLLVVEHRIAESALPLASALRLCRDSRSDPCAAGIEIRQIPARPQLRYPIAWAAAWISAAWTA